MCSTPLHLELACGWEVLPLGELILRLIAFANALRPIYWCLLPFSENLIDLRSEGVDMSHSSIHNSQPWASVANCAMVSAVARASGWEEPPASALWDGLVCKRRLRACVYPVDLNKHWLVITQTRLSVTRQGSATHASCFVVACICVHTVIASAEPVPCPRPVITVLRVNTLTTAVTPAFVL